MFVSKEDVEFAAIETLGRIPDEICKYFSDLGLESVQHEVAVAKRGVVKSFVEARLENRPVDQWVSAGSHLAAIDLVSKAKKKWDESDHKRDAKGRFTRKLGGKNLRTDTGAAFQDPNGLARDSVFGIENMIANDKESLVTMATDPEIDYRNKRSEARVMPQLRDSNYRKEVESKSDDEQAKIGAMQYQHQESFDHIAGVVDQFGIKPENQKEWNITGSYRMGGQVHQLDPVGLDKFLSGNQTFVNVGQEIIDLYMEPADSENNMVTITPQMRDQYDFLQQQQALSPSLMRRGVDAFTGDYTGESRRNDLLLNRQPKESRMGAFARKVGAAAEALGLENVQGIADNYGYLEGELGDTVKETAYRLRGTEMRPDKSVVSSVNTSRSIAENPAAAKEAAENFNAAARGKGDAFAVSPALGSWLYHQSRDGGSKRGEQLQLAATGDGIAANLIERLPGDNEVALMQASGSTPASQGVLVDANGDLVAQSVGYGEDHFLPFTAKMLKDAQGGQYVRTRAVGGLTSEDLKNTIFSGARQATVVSRSGVFTIELDPDMRGGRRYSDKAMQMVDRYEAMLGKLSDRSAYLPQNDISPEEKDRIRNDAISYAGPNASEKDIQDRFNVLVNDRRRQMKGQPAATDEERQNARVWAERAVDEELADMPGDVRRGVNRDVMVAEKLEEFNDKRTVKPLALNSEGYALALNSLAQAYPQFIRSVTAETIPDFMRNRKIGTTKYTEAAGERDSAPGRVDGGYIISGTPTTSASRSLSAPKSPKTDDGGSGPSGGGSAPVGGGGAPQSAAPAAPGSISVDNTPLGNALKAGGTDLLKETASTLSGTNVISSSEKKNILDKIGEVRSRDLATDNQAAWQAMKFDEIKSNPSVVAAWVLGNVLENTVATVDRDRDKVAQMLNDPDQARLFTQALHEMVPNDAFQSTREADNVEMKQWVIGNVFDSIVGSSAFAAQPSDPMHYALNRSKPILTEDMKQIRDEPTLQQAVTRDGNVATLYRKIVDESVQGTGAPTFMGFNEAAKNDQRLLASYMKLQASSKPPEQDVRAWQKSMAGKAGVYRDQEFMDGVSQIFDELSTSSAEQYSREYQKAWGLATLARRMQIGGAITDPKVLGLTAPPKEMAKSLWWGSQVSKRDPGRTASLVRKAMQEWEHLRTTG